MVAINLAIVASGISLIQVGAFNVTMEHTPLQFSGVSLSMSVLLVLIGSGSGGPFPSPLSYNLIFLTATLISAQCIYGIVDIIIL